MKVLITGGAGFIGSHLARRALAAGHDVVVVDNLSTGYRSNVPDGARFVHVDLANPNHYYRLGDERPEVIFHLAAQSSGWVSFDSPMRDLDDNLRATILLTEWALGRGCKRLLFASTESVYGEGSATRAHVETDLPRPLSFYGCSKLAAEHYLRVSAAELGLQPTCLRLFTVYGPKQDLANMRQGITSIYLSYVLRGEPVLVKGSLERVRDLVVVDDIVEAFWLASQEPKTIGQELNVATGQGITIRELIKRMGANFGHADYPTIPDAGTPGDVLASFGDSSKLTALTGWKPRTLIDEGLAQIASAFKQ